MSLNLTILVSLFLIWLAPFVSVQVGLTDDFDYLELVAPIPLKAVAE